MSHAVRVIIRGRVQGVGYRAWTEETARELGLSGWVRNRRDGCVEAVFMGHDDVIEEMLALCMEGPAGAAVTDLDTHVSTDAVEAGFRMLPTE